MAKKYAHDTKFSGKHANLVYMKVALHFNWEDAAEHFFTQYVQEK